MAQRVLIADDDKNVRAILGHTLRTAGYEVFEAPDGATALQIADRERPDIILLDHQMGDPDGLETCRRLKKHATLGRRPVILCSSLSSKEDVREALRAGADDFVSKPYNREMMLRKIAHRLAMRTAVREGGTERRLAIRKQGQWTVSWGRKQGAMESLYKARVLDISLTGFAFDFDRCVPCTGYEVGTVHPQCLFAPWGLRFAPKADVADFLLSVTPEVILEVHGAIVHVQQDPVTPATERVGVEFKGLSDESAAVIKSYVDGHLKF